MFVRLGFGVVSLEILENQREITTVLSIVEPVCCEREFFCQKGSAWGAQMAAQAQAAAAAQTAAATPTQTP